MDHKCFDCGHTKQQHDELWDDACTVPGCLCQKFEE